MFFGVRLSLRLVVCCVTVFGASVNERRVSVTIANGATIHGRLVRTLYAGQTFAAFKGIPYAEPPVGGLRFKAPVKKATYPEHVNALEFGHICPRFGKETGSEDCLFLNVYTPDVRPAQPLAVMVFIHGGTFYEGSGNDGWYGSDFLVEENVVLVTLNYRLGPFGFLSLGTAEYSGNMGLKDQQLALCWVNEHIGHFGGNPSDITLFGHSAGGASTHFHVLAESSDGLFKRAIAMSGSAGNPWAIGDPSRQFDQMLELAQKYDSTISTYPELLQWLTEVPTAVLRDSMDPRVKPDTVESDMHLIWTPVIEKKGSRQPFLELPNPLQNYVSDKDVMFGYTSAEWIYLMDTKLADPSKLNRLDTDFTIDLPWPRWSVNRESKDFPNMMADIRTYYFGENSTIDLASAPTLVALMSDIVFGYGVNQSVRKHAAVSTGNTFYYRFSADTKLNAVKIHNNSTALAGAAHGDELCYLFKCSFQPGLYDQPADSVERNAQKNLLKLWTNFAKHGHPAPNDEPVVFQPVRPDAVNFVDIRNGGLVAGLRPHQQFYSFWDRMLAKYS